MKLRLILLILSGLMFSTLAAGNSVGALPGTIDFGTVNPGETVTQEIYIRGTNVPENFSIRPSANSVDASTLFSGDAEDKREISEQSAEDWWNFERSLVNPETEVDYSEVNVQNPPTLHGSTTATLEIPNDAEPGVRYGHIRLNPDFSPLNQSSGSGAKIVSPTRLTYSFRVSGTVRRDIEVQDVRGFRLDEDEAAVEVLLVNEGTVTTSTENLRLDILDSSRDEETTLTASGTSLAPGESQWVEANWADNSGIEQGEYQVGGQVDYLTGSATASGDFSLPDFDVVEVRPEDSPGSDNQDGGSVPIWFVIIVLVILGVLMWGFEIEPFWIVTILGVLGISAFVLLSGLPNYLLVVLLIMVGIVIYGGM
ncbi:hypothetical protein [Candidatus Nanohalobium constans]|uniref:Uncharacterized protein n=1 Tax=Candidatus Nanohalobium constans TaxID=2565781 RepID=A0A5Q0UFZ9_9ARCH|nr:hypothetical protein [Candidatus Nanohalobium constans]QGA80130.1 hypothetical protein LC1Nh_0226 [Candidatus Nanohalobium constans]